MSYDTYYHYTSEEGAKAINKSKVLRASKDKVKDAVIGNGIYFTRLPPQTGEEEIAQNNWTQPYSAAKDKMRYVVVVKVDKLWGDHVFRSGKTRLGGRDVYVLEERKLRLREVKEWEIRSTWLTLYHYTDREGMRDIFRDARIDKTDGKLGRGVYLHEIEPDKGKMKIAQNNWGSRWKKAFKRGKADYCFKLVMSLYDKKLVDGTVKRGKDIYMYNGKLKLKRFPNWEVKCSC